jgi:cytochrome c-type biogenesis protein CcmH/NrfG
MTTDRAGTVQIPSSGTRLTVLRERKQAMARSRPQRIVLPLAALALAVLLGGCVVYPAYPAHGYPPRYYGGPYVGVGGGWYHGGW